MDMQEKINHVNQILSQFYDNEHDYTKIKKSIKREILDIFQSDLQKCVIQQQNQQQIQQLQLQNMQNSNEKFTKQVHQLQTFKTNLILAYFSITIEPFLISVEFVKEMILNKYKTQIQERFQTLEKSYNIINYFFIELFEQMKSSGIKNLKEFFFQKYPVILTQLSNYNFEQEGDNFVELKHISKHLQTYFEELSKKGSKIKQPHSHKKRKSIIMTHIYPQNEDQYQQQKFLNRTKFNDLHNLQFMQPQPVVYNSVLANYMPLGIPNNLFDIIFIFMGDIQDSKILNSSYLEKHIESFDRRYREQKYKPNMNKIHEVEEGYDSDYSSPGSPKRRSMTDTNVQQISSGNALAELVENMNDLIQFLQGMCFEAIETLQSGIFQIYFHYQMNFQYQKLINRIRLLFLKHEKVSLTDLNQHLSSLVEKEFLYEKSEEVVEKFYQNVVKQNEIYKQITNDHLPNISSMHTDLINSNCFIKEMIMKKILQQSFEEMIRKIFVEDHQNIENMKTNSPLQKRSFQQQQLNTQQIISNSKLDMLKEQIIDIQTTYTPPIKSRNNNDINYKQNSSPTSPIISGGKVVPVPGLSNQNKRRHSANYVQDLGFQDVFKLN